MRAEQFDDVSFAQTFVLQPLLFLGGVFYSATLLPEPFETLTHFNPIYYMIGLVRYGFLGYHETNVALSLLFLTLATAALFALNHRLFAPGLQAAGLSALDGHAAGASDGDRHRPRHPVAVVGGLQHEPVAGAARHVGSPWSCTRPPERLVRLDDEVADLLGQAPDRRTGGCSKAPSSERNAWMPSGPGGRLARRGRRRSAR